MAVGGLHSLPNVLAEVNAIVRTTAPNDLGVFSGQALLDEVFTYEALRDALAGHQILHIATHAKFELGLPQNSCLLDGVGRIAAIPTPGLRSV